MRLAVLTRNARLNAIETEIGTAPILQLRSGATLPAAEGDAATGTLLWEETLPSDWMAAASAGAKALAGTWSANAVADGTVGHYELFASDGTTRKACGSASGPGGGGELVIDAASGVVTNGQTITITTFTLTEGNAWA